MKGRLVLGVAARVHAIRRRRVGSVLALTIALVAMTVVAAAYWSAHGSGTGAAAVGSMTPATISVPSTATLTVAVSWTAQASLAPSSAAGGAITYEVQRKLGSGAYATVSSGGCAGAKSLNTTSCTDSPPGNGSYSYRAIANLHMWTAISADAGPVSYLGIDTTAPTVRSIDRADADPTNATTLRWTVTFSEAVSGVDAADFALVRGGGVSGGSIASVTGSATTYTVSTSSGSGSGTLGLSLVDNDSIRDTSLNVLGGLGAANGNFTGQVYTVDRTAPTAVSIVTADPSPTNAASVSWTVTFSEAVGGVSAANFALTRTGSVSGATITSVTGSAATRTVTASTGSGDGAFGLNLASPASITDAAGNTMSGSLTGPSYTLDRSAPTGVTLQMPSGTLRGSVTLSATATDTSAITVVRLQRSPAGAGTWTDACTDSTSPYACAFDTTVVADGSYDFRAIASDAAQNTGTSAVAANRLIDNVGPTVALADPGADVRATIALTVTAGDGAGSGVASVRIERSPADANSWSQVCIDTSSPYGCSLDTATLANDAYDLRAVATDATGNATTSTIQTIGVDNALPSVTLTNPGTPLSGSVILTTTAADADSGIATVTIQRATAGASTWTDVCVIATSPWSCGFATTTVADGLYDLRAIAVDVAGNTATSAIVSARRVDNTISSVSLDDPGSPLRATVTLTANANSSAGVGSVLIQRSPAGAATWTDVCSDTTSPYSCSLNTAGGATPDGSYDFRATMTTTAGASLTSATIANRIIDNNPVRGVDIQAANSTAGKLGKMEVGDTLTLTYSAAMKASTLIAGWSGSGNAALFVRLTDAGGLETTRLTTDANANNPTGLGTFVTAGNFIRTGRTATFAATAALSSGAGGVSIVNITLGTLSGSGLRAQAAATTLRWTPAATATNIVGTTSSTAVATESGAADRDF